MDYAKVVGIMDFNFSDDSGRVVAGKKYHMVTTSGKMGLSGYEVMSQSIMQQALLDMQAAHAYLPAVGDVCGLTYNRRGRIDKFEPLEDADGLFDAL